MKKIININFHSRVIPIEETAYEILQQYIDSLRRYFANEEGGDEIISDIENRFAELFSETLKKGAPCITDADVNSIIASMGRPEQFEGENAESVSGGAAAGVGGTAAGGAASGRTGSAGGQGGNQQNWQFANEPRRLYRAENDKILGGVCAGLANYLKIDPAIVRILFVLLTTGWGAGFLLYIVLWVVLPTRALPAAVRKRLYRNPDDRVIGGVASGIAAYFHIQVWIPRLIFCTPLILGIVASIANHAVFPWSHWDFSAFFTGGFGGSLFITYIVLWIVLPEAVTASEKLEMRGEKVDIESIKNTIKSDLENFKGRATEVGAEMRDRFQNMGSTVRQNAQTWGNEAGPAIRRTSNGFGHAVGVLFKAFFLFIAGIIAFALIMALVGIAFRGGNLMNIKGLILEGFWQNFLAWSAFFLFLVIPVVALLTWLIRRISGTRSRSHYLGYTFATLWILGLFATIALFGMVMNNFRSQQHVEQGVELIQPTTGKLTVRALEPNDAYDDADWFWHFDIGRNTPFYPLDDDSVMITSVRVLVVKSEDSSFHVKLVKISRGSSVARARELAGGIRFNVGQQDSMLNLPFGLTLARGDKFRNQKVVVLVSVPVGKRIQMASSVDDYSWININPGRHHINWDNDDYDWKHDWDEDFPGVNSYSWSSGVEYRMTADGLVETGKRTESNDEGRHYKYEDRKHKDQKDKDDDDDDDDDDNPGYKSSKPAHSKPDSGGYRYKGPGSTDSPAVKKTAMREMNLLNVLDKV